MLDFLYSIFPSLNMISSSIEPRERINLKPSPLKVKKRVRFESTPLLQKDEKEKILSNYCCDHEDREKKSGIIRVKILMRKEAADRLISKCKDGGILEFNDVAQHLEKIPGNAVRVVALNNKHE